MLTCTHRWPCIAWVTDPAQPPSREQIRDHLIVKLNNVLRRTSMYGGEGALLTVFDLLFFTEGLGTDWWERQRAAWQARGAFSPLGPKGAFQHLLPGDVESAVASLYAEVAHKHRWLAADRSLDANEYTALRSGVGAWAGKDRTHTDVLDAYGPPSILFGGTSPRYPKTIGYLTEHADDPLVFFHLGNEAQPSSRPAWPPPYNEAVLFAVRCGTGAFQRSFVFTPLGQRLRPEPHQAHSTIATQ